MDYFAAEERGAPPERREIRRREYRPFLSGCASFMLPL
jgi:hypothetical protein